MTGGADGVVRIWKIPRPRRRRLRSPGPASSRATSALRGAFPVGGDDLRDAGRRPGPHGGQGRHHPDLETATGRELHCLRGHEDELSDLALSADGRLALSGSLDRTARLWDVDSGRELGKLLGHERKVRAVALSPDGRLALTGSEENPIRLWDVATRKEIRRLNGHDKGLFAVAFSPDGKRALSGSVDGTARLWDVESGRELRTLSGPRLGHGRGLQQRRYPSPGGSR